MPIQAHENHVLGSFDPQTLFFIIETPKGLTLRGNTRFEP